MYRQATSATPSKYKHENAGPLLTYWHMAAHIPTLPACRKLTWNIRHICLYAAFAALNGLKKMLTNSESIVCRATGVVGSWLVS